MMDCTFPSEELLAERRKMAQMANESRDERVVEACANFVLRCDQLRMWHEEITGCDCWIKAVKESNEGSRDKREICERV